jgi:hypothetical protein
LAVNQSLYDKIVNDPFNLVSFSLAVIAVVLGIVPLVLLVAERKRTQMLNETMKEFAILDQIRSLTAESEEKKKLTEAEARQIEERAKTMREDVERRIPDAALVAYYENTIPQLEQSLLDVSVRLDTMVDALKEIKGTSSVVSAEVQTILSRQVAVHVAARRRLEIQQLLLVLSTSIFAVIVSVFPYPLSFAIGVLGGSVTIAICGRMMVTARYAYPDNRFLGTRWLRRKFVIVSVIIFIVTVIILTTILFSTLS